MVIYTYNILYSIEHAQYNFDNQHHYSINHTNNYIVIYQKYE